MIRRWTLYALSRIVVSDGEEHVERALRGCDPLVAHFCRRKLARALHQAELESARPEPAHVARIASFRVAGIDMESSFDDESGIFAEYAEKLGEQPRPSRGPRLLLGLTSACVLALGIAFAVHWLTRPFEPSQTPEGRAFEHDFTALSIALANGDSDSARRKLATFRAEPSLVPVAASLGQLVEASAKVRGDLRHLDPYRAAGVALNKKLEEAKLPFFVDTDLFPIGGKVSPILLSFYVQERATYRSGDKDIPVLRLWRLDHMNVAQSKLGYTSASSPYAVVLLDLVERDLVTQILPAIPNGELMSLTDEDTELSREDWVARVQRAGADIIRKHYAALQDDVRTAAQRLGPLLARRRALLSEWNKAVRGDSTVLRLPRRLVPEADYTSELHLRVPSTELREWDSLHDELLDGERLADFERVRESYLRSVERHEVQHRIDYAAERLEIPELVAERLGGISRMGHETNSVPMGTTAELSAYLAQIADDPAPLLALVTMSRICLSKYTNRTTHGVAAFIALEAIAKELGIDTDEAIGRSASREELAFLLERLGDTPSDRLRTAARRAFETLFGERLAHVQRASFERSESWRH